MNDDFDLKEMEQEIEKILRSELSLLEMMKPKELKIDLEASDTTFYMNRYWFSLPYPKSFGMGIINITS